MTERLTQSTIDHWAQFIKKQGYETKQGLVQLELNWRYAENILLLLNNIIDTPKPDLTLEQRILDALRIHNKEKVQTVDFMFLLDEFKRHEGIDLDDTTYDDDLIDWFEEHVRVDYRFEELVRHSVPEDLTIYFGTKHAPTICRMWYDLKRMKISDRDITQALLDANDPVFRLLQSQGYTPSDLLNDTIRETSLFLQSVYHELYNPNLNQNDLIYMQLVALPEARDWYTIYHAACMKTGTLTKGVRFGLFNPKNGTHSHMSIRLESALSLEMFPHWAIRTEWRKQPMNYTPRSVFHDVDSIQEEQLLY